jgi:type II secretory pathway pseudopilin PulG
MAASPASRGFVLLEALVALAVLGLALAVLMPAGIGAVRQLREAEALGRANLAAQSLMAGVGVAEETPLRPGITSGRLGDGTAWRIEVRALPAPSRGNWQPWAVAVVVDDAGGRPLARLESIRLAPR